MPPKSQGQSKLLEQEIRDLRRKLSAVRRSLKKHEKANDQTGLESKARIKAILDTAVDAIITIDEKGIIESFNPAAERIFGYKADWIIGKSLNLLMPYPYAEKHDGYIRRYLKTGKAHIIGIGREIVAQRSDGTVFPIDLAVSEVRAGNRITFTGIIRDITERKKLEKAIVAASEGERLQIGQDLHDTLGQQLAGLAMLCRGLQRQLRTQNDAMTPEAEKIAELARTALAQTRKLAHGLYPVELERRGLGIALQELADYQEELFKIRCIYRGTTDIPPLDRAVSVNLYRIAQEAVSNAVKHAQARTIEIHLEQRGARLILTVTDDGCGIPGEIAQSDGMGLAIMKYRATMVGAEWRINSSPGKGTSVICDLPIGELE